MPRILGAAVVLAMALIVIANPLVSLVVVVAGVAGYLLPRWWVLVLPWLIVVPMIAGVDQCDSGDPDCGGGLEAFGLLIAAST